jgi:hypothetical protein
LILKIVKILSSIWVLKTGSNIVPHGQQRNTTYIIVMKKTITILLLILVVISIAFCVSFGFNFSLGYLKAPFVSNYTQCIMMGGQYWQTHTVSFEAGCTIGWKSFSAYELGPGEYKCGDMICKNVNGKVVE